MVCDAELLPEMGSEVAELTVAVFVSVPPAAGAVTLIVIVDEAPLARDAIVQVTVPDDWLQLQPVPVALTNATPAGSVSLTATLDAVLGPAFATVTV